jgi:hypothetical protein
MGMSLYTAIAKQNSADRKILKGDTFNISISGSRKPGYSDLKKVTPAGAGFTMNIFEVKKIG